MSSELMEPFLTVRQRAGTYPVYVGPDLLDGVGRLIQPRGRVFVITSHALRPRFGDRVAASFASPAQVIATNEGEAEKTLATANRIVTELIERGGRRDSLAVIVGGGMVGDTAGFAASIFLRGIDVVQVPTTLLAQVDSAIGGKVGVNHDRGKNLIGSFHPPRAVIADTSTLHSLPHRERLSGLFEALKGGVIGDPELFAIFESNTDGDEEIVRRAIRVKASIVSEDEFESDRRRLLNYGHTIAHGIEAAMRYKGITHGEAVAWGMIGANAIARRRGLLDAAVAGRIDGTIRRLEPRPLPAGLDPREIAAAAQHDKKNTDSTRVMVFPRAIGECEVVSDVTEAEIDFGVAAALEG
jgi:3-dehydroquinate synthase